MLSSVLEGVAASASASITVSSFLSCIGVSLVLGLFFAFVYAFKNKYSKSFVMTLILLPAIVCVVIMMVNGNIGAGVAVAGAFSLVRFRSAPGSAKDIAMIFMAMGTGLVTGMGYLGYAALFAVIIGIVFMLCTRLGLGETKDSAERYLRITVPEDLNYTDAFKEPMDTYAKKYELNRIKTINMGSLFRLEYNLTLKDPMKEKEFIDALRVRNGNLEISMATSNPNASGL
ncbi:MAG: DUF4956 domain-containing protein [Lachnospiraceae bacterium]|nr:DUF4956 domain-containing protein [Lachnospiraceae bacterium]